MKKIAFLGLLIALLAPVNDAFAGKPKTLGTYGDWSAYVYYENGEKVCYIASTPTKAEGNYSIRGDIFAFITHRTEDNIENEFNYIAGYGYKAGSEPTVRIDNKKFPLYTEGEVAWAENASVDMALAKAINSGNKMVVTGRSSRGTLTTDTFSLKGSSKAIAAINRECLK